jgi:hypothetical protein
MVLSAIMLEIYGSSPRQEAGRTSTEPYTQTQAQKSKNSSFIKISSEIQKWWIELPDVIRLNLKNLPSLSPPLHIVSLNLLYHTTLILLHRPFVLGATRFDNPGVLRSYHICISAAAAIHDLLVLLTATFGYSHITYLNCYSTYIAATIAVLHFQHQEETNALPGLDVPSEKLGLKFFLGVLQKTATALPALGRSVEIVKRHMQVILDRRSKKYLESLFPSDKEVHALGAERASPAVQSASLPESQNGQFAAASKESSNIPQFMPPSAENTFQTYGGFNFEGLPAFPGQNFNVGNDFTLDQEITDPTLLGLDPHVTLHHENSDWAYNGFYMEDTMQ